MRTLTSTHLVIGILSSNHPTRPYIGRPAPVNWLQLFMVYLLVDPASLLAFARRWLVRLGYTLQEYISPDRLALRLGLALMPQWAAVGVG